MKSISSQMLAHLRSGRTTLARCYRVTRTDGQVFGFTAHVRPLTIAGVTYLPDSGLGASALQSSGDLAVDNAEITGGITHDMITEDDIYAGVWSFARVRVFDVNYLDLTMGDIPQGVFWLGEIRQGRHAFVAELRSLAQKLQQEIVRSYLVLCDADLGDARCGVDLGAIADGLVAGVVTAAPDRLQFTASGLTQEAGWFTAGKVTWTTGLNAGRSMEVREHASGGQIVLRLPMYRVIQVDDEFEISAGCLKRFTEDCVSKFSNGPRHRGFPHLPGIDRMATGR